VTAVRGDSKVTVSFTAPYNGGAAITSYTAVDLATGDSKTGAASPLVVTGLINGHSYHFVVYATNSHGNSPQSTQTADVIPGAANRCFSE